MVLSCDPTKPTRERCEELPGYLVAPSGPHLPAISGPIETCKTECPRGPPGLNGTNVRVLKTKKLNFRITNNHLF